MELESPLLVSLDHQRLPRRACQRNPSSFVLAKALEASLRKLKQGHEDHRKEEVATEAMLTQKRTGAAIEVEAGQIRRETGSAFEVEQRQQRCCLTEEVLQKVLLLQRRPSLAFQEPCSPFLKDEAVEPVLQIATIAIEAEPQMDSSFNLKRRTEVAIAGHLKRSMIAVELGTELAATRSHQRYP